jgi:hypothetical protein
MSYVLKKKRWHMKAHEKKYGHMKVHAKIRKLAMPKIL